MVRPTHAVVDLDGLTANYRAIRDLLAAGAGGSAPRIIAVIKANAYGHGSARVARALEREAAERAVPPPMLACADIEEGVELRAAGVRAPILVFGALSVSDLEGVFAHDLVPTVSSPSAARALEAAAAARDVRLRVHLKIDTGMNRFGFRHDNLPATLPAVLQAPHLDVEAVYTHFATAEDRDHPLFERQRARFEAVRAAAAGLGLAGAWWHAANSAALLRDRRTWYDAVRPGLLLYGIAPPPLEPGLRLRPAMSLQSRVVAVKGMRPGEAAGYGGPLRRGPGAAGRAGPGRLRRRTGPAAGRAGGGAGRRDARADRGGVDGFDGRRRHRRRRESRGRGRPARRTGNGRHRRPRRGTRDRHGAARDPVSHRGADRADL